MLRADSRLPRKCGKSRRQNNGQVCAEGLLVELLLPANEAFDFRYTNPYPKRGCRLRSAGFRRKRFDSCSESSKHRATNPLGKGLIVCRCSFGQSLGLGHPTYGQRLTVSRQNQTRKAEVQTLNFSDLRAFPTEPISLAIPPRNTDS